MRHRVYGKHLGRNKDQRKALFRGLVYSLFLHGTIQTSQVKAKAVKGLVDKIINVAKSKRADQLQSLVPDKSLAGRIIEEIVPKLNSRTSGYTSMVKMGTRLGDQTMVVKMSLIGAEELKPIKKEKVSQGKEVPQVSQGEEKTPEEQPRDTRDASKTRGTRSKRKAVKK